MRITREQALPTRSTAFGWVTIAAGLLIALLLVAEPVRNAIGERITVQSMVAANVLFYSILFVPLIVLALVLGAIDRRRVVRAGQGPLGWAVLGLVAGAGGLSLCVAYVWLNGTLVAGPGAATPAGHLALGLAVALLGVVAEELLFRGWLLSALEDRIGTAPAVLASAIAFSIFHWWAGGATDAISLANLLLGGLWFALLAQRSGGIVAPIAAHFGWNVAESAGYGLIPNPGIDELGSLADYDMTGSVLWGGGEEGLNASIAMTLVLTALIVPLLPSLARSLKPASAS